MPSTIRLRHAILAGLVVAITTLSASQTRPEEKTEAGPAVRYVVVHKPGPNWKEGTPPFEQAGIGAHVDHYAKLLEAGKLSLGGPFMDASSGGMMIPEPGVTQEEITKFASEDPAVKSGLLAFEVRPWLPALAK